MRVNLVVLLVLMAGLLLSACSNAETPANTEATSVAAPATTKAVTTTPVLEPAQQLPRVTVHHSPTCGCCKLWVSHLEQAGFAVDTVESHDLGSIKQTVGVPAGKGSCHTAVVDGYFIEGHVPAEDVIRLLNERPKARGLTVPGMPIGSPGMEVPSGQVQPYAVLLVSEDGSTSEFSRHGH